MPKKRTRSANARLYDETRKTNTLEKLKSGMTHLRRQKEHVEGKPISIYKLSKYTGVTMKTIRKHSEIMESITKGRVPGIQLKSAAVKTDKIFSLQQAVGIINQLTDLYNETKDKYNQAIMQNSALNLENVKLRGEVTELNKVLKNRQNQ